MSPTHRHKRCLMSALAVLCQRIVCLCGCALCTGFGLRAEYQIMRQVQTMIMICDNVTRRCVFFTLTVTQRSVHLTSIRITAGYIPTTLHVISSLTILPLSSVNHETRSRSCPMIEIINIIKLSPGQRTCGSIIREATGGHCIYA